MTTWKIPVKFTSYATVDVEAKTLAEAIKKVEEEKPDPMPYDPEPSYEFYEVDLSGSENLIREYYNGNHKDE